MTVELGYDELHARAAAVLAGLPMLRAAGAAVQTGAMVALVPEPEDVDRLAVSGGEPAEQLHCTLMYLGEAADIPPDVQTAIVVRMRELVEDSIPLVVSDVPVSADGFAISIFNPESDDRQPCIVLGLSGDDLGTIHDLVQSAVADVFDAPDQHEPWMPHVTLVYTDDASRVAELTGRTGPIEFDRLRIAFAGRVTDIPLVATVPADDAPTMGRSVLHPDPRVRELVEAARNLPDLPPLSRYDR